jgi:outer membrane protein OmpA-like peptidoglycan-associated protein/uncharacterized protein YegP (UPF0339 family)
MDNTPVTPLKHEDYLPCKFYEGTSASEDGIYKFTEEGKYFFSFMDNGAVILRSEGYGSEAGRENGIASVLKNKETEAQYKVIQSEDGNWVVALFALNHQEIARSCSFATESEVLELLPEARAKAKAALLLKANEQLAKSSENLEDDYLVCGEYEERISEHAADHKNFITFLHPATNKYYFAWVTDDDKIILRSEGYPTIAARDNGMASVIKNSALEDRFKIEEKSGLYYLILRAGNHQEIGRSCPKKSEAELWALIKPEPVEPIVEAKPIIVESAAPIVVAAAAPVVAEVIKKAINTDREDDYLLCEAYQGHHVTDFKNNIAFFTHTNAQYYFVVYNTDGSVKLRSEGFRTLAERDSELAGVIEFVNSNSNYTRIERAGYEIKILKDNTGREIGRSCPKKIVLAAPPPVAKAAPVVEAAIPAAVGGFNWKWLLPLLLIPLFFMWRSCNRTPAEPVAVVETVTPVVADTQKAVEPVAPVVASADCNLHWILFDFDKYDITAEANTELQNLVMVLKNNATYTADLKAFTDAKGSDAYNENLSKNRANAAKGVLVAAGIDASRIKTGAFSETGPIATNTDDDSGRKYNRRVELFVKDASGKEVCKSIPPAVPVELKN